MLTADLSRNRITGRSIAPRFIDVHNPKYIELAEQLIKIYKDHLGRRRAELEAVLDEITVGDTDYKIIQGLTKLLADKSEFQMVSPLEPERIRYELFRYANERYPIVKRPSLTATTFAMDVYREVARRLGISPEEVLGGMYADLEENKVLTRFGSTGADEDQGELSISAEWLLHRYNLALAQALLYDASRMTIHIYDHYRMIFSYIKLFGLMHVIKKRAFGYEVELDGPASMFHLSRKYGIRMAKFLPALVLCDRWQMEAEIVVDEEFHRLLKFTLNPAYGLKSHYKKVERFDSDLERTFARKFAKAKTEWELRREDTVIDLGGRVMIPDFSLRHPDGRRALLEIVGFWTPQYLEGKLEKIKQAKLDNLIIAVSEDLDCAKQGFAGLKGEVLFFKAGLKVGEVLARAEKCSVADLPKSAKAS